MGDLERLLPLIGRQDEENERLRALIGRLQRAVARLDNAYAGEYGSNSTRMDDDTAEWLGLQPGDVPESAYKDDDR